MSFGVKNVMSRTRFPMKIVYRWTVRLQWVTRQSTDSASSSPCSSS